MPPPRMTGDGRKAKDPKKTLARLLGYLKSHWIVLLIVIGCIILSSVASTIGSTSLG